MSERPHLTICRDIDDFDSPLHRDTFVLGRLRYLIDGREVTKAEYDAAFSALRELALAPHRETP